MQCGGLAQRTVAQGFSLGTGETLEDKALSIGARFPSTLLLNHQGLNGPSYLTPFLTPIYPHR